jgi:hypothetical protein
LRIAGFNISRSGASKIEAHLSYLDDKNTFVFRGCFRSKFKKTSEQKEARVPEPLLDP